MTLPTGVVEKDRTLQKATDDLAQLRWHWTLDETNPDRVAFREYARQVGSAEVVIRNMVNGYAAYLAADARPGARAPGQPQTLAMSRKPRKSWSWGPPRRRLTAWFDRTITTPIPATWEPHRKSHR